MTFSQNGVFNMEDPWDIDEKEDVVRSKTKKDDKIEVRESVKPTIGAEESMFSTISTWRFVAVIMLALLIASIFTSGFQFGGATGAAVANPITKDEATTKAVEFINNNLLADGGVTAELVSSEDRGDLFEVKLTILGQPYSSYITKDGKLLFPQGIDLTTAAAAAAAAPAVAERVDVSADDDAVNGDEDAPVTIIEFSDFQCPFCAKFDDCVDTHKYADEVAKDFADGAAVGVTGTPAFFVNGKLLSGAQPFTAFEALIEAELAAGSADSNEVTAAAVVDTSGSTKKFTIVAKKFRFTPSQLRVQQGDTVQLDVKRDDVDFDFVLDEFGVTEKMLLGKVTKVEFVADTKGSFTYTCGNCDGKEDIMKGTLIVE